MKLKYEPLKVGYNRDGCIKRALDKLNIPYVHKEKNYLGLKNNLDEYYQQDMMYHVDLIVLPKLEDLDFTNQRGLIVLQVHDTYLHVVAVINNVYYDIVDNLHKYPIHSIIKLS